MPVPTGRAVHFAKAAYILLLGASLWACQPGGEEDAPPSQAELGALAGERVARIGDSFITSADVDRAARRSGLIGEAESLSRDHPRYQDILDELVDQRLLARHARAQGYDKDPAVRARLATARERLLAGVAAEKFVEDKITEDAARKLYDEQIARRDNSEEVRARHILVESEDEAKAVVKRLTAGADFAEIAAELSTDPGSRLDGGDLGYFVKTAMVEPFAEAAFALAPGEISAPVQTQFGWHIIRVEDRRTPPAPAFEDMREDIFSYLTYSELEKFMTKLRVEGDIEMIYPEPEVEPKTDAEPAPTVEAPEE